MNRDVLKPARKLLKSEYFSLVMGILLVVCGVLAAMETFLEDLVDVKIQSHHGIIIFGLGQALRALADILEGAEGVLVAEVAEEVEEDLST